MSCVPMGTSFPGSAPVGSGVRNRRRFAPGDTIVVPLDTERVRSLPVWQAVTTIIYNLAVALLAVHSV